MENNKVRLVCENEKIEVDFDAVKKSPVLYSMIEDTNNEGEIVIPNMRADILRKVIEFCEHYRNTRAKKITRPLHRKNLTDNGVDPWDANLIAFNNPEDLIDLIVAANFLDIEDLLELGCAKVAVLIKNKNVEEIREFLNIDNDLTSGEEARIKEELQRSNN